MIIGKYFDGDNDKALQSQQHDCYGEALRIIAHGSAQGYRNATLICDVEDSISKEDRKKLSDGFDHRTLQMAHDHLAAYWRWHRNRCDPYLDGMEPFNVGDWLSWLRQEVELWPTSSPSIVRYVAAILLNQNTETGYKAEDDLLETLKSHYSGMPEIDYCQKNSAQEVIEVKVVTKEKKTNYKKQGDPMKVLSSRKLLDYWHKTREWKQWIFCWPLIFTVVLMAAVCVWPLIFPIYFFKWSNYIVVLSVIAPILALHGAIAIFLSRGKDIASGIICFVTVLALVGHIQHSEVKEVYSASMNSIFNIFSFWLVHKVKKDDISEVVTLLGKGITFSGVALCILSSLVAWGIAWDIVENMLGPLVWLLFWFVLPFIILFGPLYEGFVSGDWSPALFIWLLPMLGFLIFSFGQWITNNKS